MSNFVHESSYIDKNVTIKQNVRIWHYCHIQEGAIIGANTTLGQNVNVSRNVIIGANCKIQNNVSVYEGVRLEDFVFCGPSCVFTNDLTPRSMYPKGPENYLSTIVKYGASIGANSTIVCGNTIGKWAMVAAGAVVTKDVDDYSLVAGVPAKHIAYVCECGNKLPQTLICSSCGTKYHFNNSCLEKVVG